MTKSKPLPDETAGYLGRELRTLRKAQGLSLADLSATTGRSESFLSKIERGVARPSVTSLQEIAEALGVPTGWFFPEDDTVPENERPFIVRNGRRRRLSYVQMNQDLAGYRGVEDHLLSASLDRRLAMGISTYQPGSDTGDDLYAHEGEEAGLVTSGEIELTLNDQVFLLRTGDSFSFDASIPHRYRNRSAHDAQIVWANTPISLKRHRQG